MKPILSLLCILSFCMSVSAQNLSKLSYAEIANLMVAEYGTGAYDKAILCAEAGRDKAKKEFGVLDSVFANFTAYLGFFYHQTGQYPQAELLLLEAQNAYAKSLGETHPDFASNLNNLAMLYTDMGNYEKAELIYVQTKNIRAKILGTMHPDYAINLDNLASLYLQMGHYEKAEPLFWEAIKIRSKVLGEMHPDYALSLNNLAVLYQYMENNEKAEPLLLQAKNIWIKTLGAEHQQVANALNNLAGLYLTLKQYEKAEPFYLEAKDIRAKTLGESHPLFALSLDNLALLYKTMGNYEKAETLYLQAKNIRAKVLGELHPNFGKSVEHLASLYEKMNQVEKAEQLHLQAVDIYTKTLGGEPYQLIAVLNQVAEFYIKMDKLDIAFHYCQLALMANCTKIDSSFTDVTPRGEARDVPLRFQAWSTLDELKYISGNLASNSMKELVFILQTQYQKTGDKTKLELRYQITQAAIRFNNRIRNDFSGEGEKLRRLATNNYFVLQGIKTGIALGKEGYLQETFDFAEMNKGVLLMDVAKTSNAYKFGDLPDSLASQEKLLQKKHATLEAKLLENRPKEEQDSLLSVLNKTNQEIEIFTKILKTQYPKYAAIKYENKNVKLVEIQALLDEKTALLEYVLGDSVIYVFYIDKKNTKLLPIYISTNFLAAKIKEFHSTMSDYKLVIKDKKLAYQKYTETAFWFYENLVAPTLKNAKGITKLIIVSDGELGHLPFEAFLVKPAPQKETDYRELNYLINNYKISYDYSATLWKANKDAAKNTNNGQLLAMAANYDIKLDGTKIDWRLPAHQRLRTFLNPLPAARKEVEVLAETFTGFFALDSLASEKVFKEKAGDYAVIHLAMHGLLDAKGPILSSIAFTEDGDSLENNFLHAHEISKMKLNADLVVLSACQTGYGRFDKGNGIASLAQAFAYAGAPALIVSLWSVNDYATSEIMKDLYQNLTDGMEKDEALQQAKLKYMKEAKGVMAHPAFWSPFILIGNTDAIYLKTKSNWFWWVAGACGLGLGGCLWAMKFNGKRKA